MDEKIDDLTDTSNYMKGAILSMKVKDFMQFRTVTINPGTYASKRRFHRRLER